MATLTLSGVEDITSGLLNNERTADLPSLKTLYNSPEVSRTNFLGIDWRPCLISMLTYSRHKIPTVMTISQFELSYRRNRLFLLVQMKEVTHTFQEHKKHENQMHISYMTTKAIPAFR